MEYEVIISRASPYSSKVVALLGYAGIPHRIRIQNAVSRYCVVKRLTGKTMVPVLRRGSWALHDSTEISRYIMERTDKPTLPTKAGELMAWLLEDFADEWIVRWMVQSRWRHREDAEHVGEVIGRELTGKVPVGEKFVGRQASKMIRSQLKTGGMRRDNDQAMQNSATRCLEALEAILSEGAPYLFGGYPTVADFAFFGCLIQYYQDPTGRDRLQGYRAVRAYIRRLQEMEDRPASAHVEPCAPRPLSELQPLFGEMLGTYWPVLIANQSVLEGDDAWETGKRLREVSAELIDGTNFSFRPSGYMMKRLFSLLELVDETYQRGDRLFGEDGLRMERALVSRIADLSRSEAGRMILRSYEHLGLH